MDDPHAVWVEYAVQILLCLIDAGHRLPRLQRMEKVGLTKQPIMQTNVLFAFHSLILLKTSSQDQDDVVFIDPSILVYICPLYENGVLLYP
jgi:hypothetical protein